jgi:hypothetical protein
MLDPLPLNRCSTAFGNNCVRSVVPCSSSVTALSDARLPSVCNACRKADRWSGTGVGRPLREKSDSSVSSPSSSSMRNEGLTGVISKKPAARCQDRAKLLMLLTPPASPRAPICCPIEDLHIVSLAIRSEPALLTSVVLIRQPSPSTSPFRFLFDRSLRLAFSPADPIAHGLTCPSRPILCGLRSHSKWTAASLGYPW